jgi:hypothetical protein
MTITDLPQDIQSALNRLAWHENGILWGLRYSSKRMFNHTHTLDAGMMRGLKIIFQGPGGELVIDHDGAGKDDILPQIPGIGTAVVQIQRAKGIVRTSRIHRVGFYGGNTWGQIDLEGFGPAAGPPVGGDSGSVCFYRDITGIVRPLGICIYGGTTSYPMPQLDETMTPAGLKNDPDRVWLSSKPVMPPLSAEESLQSMDDLLGGFEKPTDTVENPTENEIEWAEFQRLQQENADLRNTLSALKAHWNGINNLLK